jgi:hypothetical protein
MKSVVGDLRMRRAEADRARLLETEARIVGGNALDHDGGLACFFGAVERIPDQPRPHTDALAVRPNRHRREIEDPCTGSAFDTPTQLSITCAITPEESSATSASSGMNAPGRPLHHGMFRDALGTDDDAPGHAWRWSSARSTSGHGGTLAQATRLASVAHVWRSYGRPGPLAGGGALFHSLTSDRDEPKIVQTADYFVTPAPIPCSVALFSCPCGATAVEYDVKRVAPAGWSTADDGVLRCPACTAVASSRAPGALRSGSTTHHERSSSS